MDWLREQWRRLEFLFRRRRLEEDLAEEMRLHLDLRAAERTAQGAEPSDADAGARRQFGNVTQLREISRDVWGWAWFDSLAQDVRYGVRALAANPGFTLTAVLSLALGIGANTAIFSIVNAVMLRSLPVEDPQRLVQVSSVGDSFTNPLWEQIRDHQQALSGSLAYSSDRFDLADGGETHLAEGIWASGDFFRVLGVPPFHGRVFTTEDDRRGGGKFGPVAVISYRFWQAHFGGDPGVVGKTIRLNRHRFEVVGVTPPWFTGLDVDRGYDVAIPIGCEPILARDQSALDHRSWWWLRILGRLAPGTTLKQAEARMKSIAPEIHRATLPANWDARDQKEYLRATFNLRPAAAGFSETGAQYRTALFTLMAVVGLVLLIACANIANLLLARAAARQREISIRLAIGAGRRRVIRQLLTESLLLSLLGAAGGLLFARWGSGLLVGFLSTARNPLELDVSPDIRVLAFTAGIAALTGILFGLAPAFRATRVAPNQVMKENARGFVAGASRFRLGKALVAGQVALSLVLLIGAGLFLGTMRNLLTVATGFNHHNVLIVHADTLAKVPKARRNELYERILDRLRGLPGVTSAACSMMTPISHQIWNEWTYPEGYQAKSREDTLTYFNRVSPGYFRTMGTQLLMGRDFNGRDTAASPLVMVINETAARHFFGTASPIGRTIKLDVMGKPGAKESYEVIGVVKDAKYQEIREQTLRTAYLAMAQDREPWPMVDFEARSAGIEALMPRIRAAMAEIDRGISLEFHNFETQVDESLLQERTIALLSSFFGALALLLAMIGLYGITAYAVARRRGEIGIRMALGASRGSVVRLVLRDVIVMLAAGTVLGVAASLAAGRLVASLLYGVKPADPATIAAAACVLAAATAIAGCLPALRASRLDPSAALRDE
jgi:predicted permease